MELCFNQGHLIAIKYDLKKKTQTKQKQKMSGKFCLKNNLMIFLHNFVLRQNYSFHSLFFFKPLLIQLYSSYDYSLTYFPLKTFSIVLLHHINTDLCICSTSKHLYNAVVLYSCRLFTQFDVTFFFSKKSYK